LTDDRELWDRICRRDASAFEELYRAYRASLQAFLRRAVSNPQAAEDVTQETFASIWRHPNGFDPARGTLRSYLLGAGRKRAAEWWRQQKPQGEAETERTEECGAETRSLIGDALARLTAEQQSLLWLREVEGQSYTELAAILEIPVGTVRSRLFAAREALRKIWRGERNTEGEV
jgi:RNA polymerase sigma-70 factor (ECF subfamily)